MLLRTMTVAAATAMIFTIQAAPAAAQARGLDRAAISSSRAASAPGQIKDRSGKQNRPMPPGIAKRFPDGATLPPGISRTRGGSAPPTDPGPDPEPEPDGGTCIMGVLFVNGVPVGIC